MNPETAQCALGHLLEARYSQRACGVDHAISRAVTGSGTAGCSPHRLRGTSPRLESNENCRSLSANFQIADDPIVSLEQNFVTLGNGLVDVLDLDTVRGP